MTNYNYKDELSFRNISLHLRGKRQRKRYLGGLLRVKGEDSRLCQWGYALIAWLRVAWLPQKAPIYTTSDDESKDTGHPGDASRYKVTY